LSGGRCVCLCTEMVLRLQAGVLKMMMLRVPAGRGLLVIVVIFVNQVTPN